MSFTRPLTTLVRLIDRFFISEKFKSSPFDLKKARLFIYITFLLIFFSSLYGVLAEFTGYSKDVPYITAGIFLALLSLLLFRKYGNFKLSGNLLAIIYAAFVGETIFRTGGLYSDNLLWLMVCPLLAMLFSGKYSGVFWLTGLCGFTYYLYAIEPGGETVFRDELVGFNHQYYFISFSTLFITVSAIVLAFVVGADDLIEELRTRRDICQQRTIEVTLKAEALQETEQKLREKNSELEQFAYAASHDLKEPLRMIGAYSSLLKKRLNGQLDESSQEFFGFVTDGASRMDKMLNDLLEYARLGNECDVNEHVDLNAVLDKAKCNLASKIEWTGAVIKSGKLPLLRCSETQMIRLFQNLIGNAIKFRRKDTTPTIEIEYELIDGHTHTFHIKDNGIGIAQEHRERIFNVFEKLHARTEYDGTGIGLASCKKIVTNLGGDISIVGEEEQGAVFKIEIPIKLKTEIMEMEIEEAMPVEVKQKICEKILSGQFLRRRKLSPQTK